MRARNSIFPAAIYLAAGAEVCKDVFEADEEAVFHNDDEALKHIKEGGILSLQQKRALYLYMYLYSKLTKKDISKVEFVKDALGINKGFQKNIETLLTVDKIKYISMLYEKEGKEASAIFTDSKEIVMQMFDSIVCAPIVEEKKHLKGLVSDEYEHPLDRAALETLKSSSTLKNLLKLYTEYAVERAEIIRLTGSSFRITEDNIPYAYDVLAEACKVLDIRKMPELYISDIGLNAYTTGSSKTIIVLGSACLSLLTHDELLFILGHELGHIKSNHVMYHLFARTFPIVGKVFGNLTLGIGDIISSGLSVSIMEWYRKSEFTADRAGLLACQNPDAAFTVMTKLAGYPMKYYVSIDKKYILEQARQFEGLDGDGYNKMLRVMSIMNATHPWTVMRAKELDKWVKDGTYEKLLNGKAKKNTEAPKGSSFKVSFR